MTQIFGELKFFSAEPGTNQFVLQQRKAFRVFFSCLPSNSMNRFILYSIGGVCVSDGYNESDEFHESYFLIYRYIFATIEGGVY